MHCPKSQAVLKTKYSNVPISVRMDKCIAWQKLKRCWQPLNYNSNVENNKKFYDKLF